MTTFHRRGHYRRGANGRRYWVNGHTMTRGGRPSASARPISFPIGMSRRESKPPAPAVKWRRLPESPNAICPRCGQPVWFYRNSYGGCAYFDVLGEPWTKHPCMELGNPTPETREATNQAIRDYRRAQKKQAGAAQKARRRETPAHVQEGRLEHRQHPGLNSPTPQAAGRATTGSPQPHAYPVQSPDVEPKPNKSLTWAMGFAALVAWVLSLPVSVAAFQTFPSEMPIWLFHWLVTLPTMVTLPALLWFLMRIRPVRFTWLDLLVTIVVAPIALVLSIFGNLLSLGLGLLVISGGLIRDASMARSDRTVDGP